VGLQRLGTLYDRCDGTPFEERYVDRYVVRGDLITHMDVERQRELAAG
jgi:hypothetical protein